MWPRVDKGLRFIENSVLFELGFPQCVSLLTKQAWLINKSSLVDAEGTYAHGIAYAVSACAELCQLLCLCCAYLCNPQIDRLPELLICKTGVKILAYIKMP